MSRIAILAAGVLIAAGAAPAEAARETDRRIQAALACAGIAADQQRLLCFDQAIATLKSAVQSGELGVRESAADPVALEGVIKASGSRGYNRFWVQLDNGDRWEVEARSNDDAPRRGDRVRFKKSPLGSYSFSGPGYPWRRATFLGRSSN